MTNMTKQTQVRSTEEALKLALEALKQIDEAMPFPVAKLAQAALREALVEQPAQQRQEPLINRVANKLFGDIEVSVPNILPPQLPIESVLIEGRAYTVPAQVAGEILRLHLEIKAAQPQQEPVATVIGKFLTRKDELRTCIEPELPLGTKLYTSPPAQPQPQPVGYVAENGVVDWNVCAPPIMTDLYTSPPTLSLAQRQSRSDVKPLTDDEIWREYRFLWPFHPDEERKLASDILLFARAIEASHGIKENT